MKTYTTDELKEILRLHILWLGGYADGRKANLSRSNLSGSDLRAQFVESRLHGAVPLVDANIFEPWILEEDWVVVVLRRRAHAQIDALAVLDLEAPSEGAAG